jgi:hypothetical protein
MHIDVIYGRDAENLPERQLQWEKEVVVIANDPPEFGIAEITVSQQIYPVAIHHGVKTVVETRRGIDTPTHSERVAFVAFVENRLGVTGIFANHDRTSAQLTD